MLAEQLKILSPDGDNEGAFIVPALDARYKFSVSRIEETALENLCSNLPLLEVLSCLHLLHLTCVATGHLSSHHGQCVMAALSPHRFFAAWRGEALFSAVSPSDGLVLSSHDSAYVPHQALITSSS